MPETVSEMGLISGNGNVACWAKADLVRPIIVTAIPALTVQVGNVRFAVRICPRFQRYSNKAASGAARPADP